MGDTPTLFWAMNGLLTMLVVVLWSIMTDIRKQLKETAKELNEYKVASAEKYASREELREVLSDVKESLRRIEDRLNKDT